MSNSTNLDETDRPVKPKNTVDPEKIPQPRAVEWGHLTKYRGDIRNNDARITQQTYKHTFNEGLSKSGRRLPLYRGSIYEAHKVYLALDALFTGGVMEVGDE